MRERQKLMSARPLWQMLPTRQQFSRSFNSQLALYLTDLLNAGSVSFGAGPDGRLKSGRLPYSTRTVCRTVDIPKAKPDGDESAPLPE